MNSPVEAELDPPFEILEPADCRGPVVFNSPAQRAASIPRAFLTAAKLDLATLRRSEDSFVDELIAGVVRARPPAGARALPALLCGREPRALRARSAHVRRAPAVLRQYALDARRGRARHGRARGRRRAGNLPPAHSDRRRAAPHRGALQALPPRAAAPADARAPRFRHRRAGRLPLDAVDRRRQGRPAARRRRARRPLRHELRADRRRRRSRRRSASSATRSAATSPTRAASSPSTTAIRPPACIRSRSRSIARSTWTSGATSARASFARLAGRHHDCWPTGSRNSAGGAQALPGGRRIASAARIGDFEIARVAGIPQKERGRLQEAAQV